MIDLSKLPPLHPSRIGHAIRVMSDNSGKLESDEIQLAFETCRGALDIVRKLQTGFGFAPDLYDKVEMAKTTVAQGRTIFGAIKGLMGKK